MKTRREFVLLAGACAVSRSTGAQSQKLYRIGLLTPGPALSDRSPQLAAFLSAMSERGYVLGQNLHLDPVVEHALRSAESARNMGQAAGDGARSFMSDGKALHASVCPACPCRNPQ